jgi:processive 1,2-diacylglycerol beta-glucosyltransferase
MTNTQILILTASFGDGHLQASRALKMSFLERGIGNVNVIDLLKEAHPVLNVISRKLYITSTKTLKYGLDYYGWSYYVTRNNNHYRPWSKYFNYLGQKKLKEIIDEVKPEAIVNVFPFGAAPEVASERGISTFTILTDYALHSRWLHLYTDKYYVATKELKIELLKKGFNENQIEVTGIPIREAFYHVSKTDNSFVRLLDPEKKTVMIAAGAYGVLNDLDSIIKSLQTRIQCQIVIVCGRNEKMKQTLRNAYETNSDVHIFGFVENMQDLMSVSSCIITKAGGLTLTEALTLSLPVFIFKPFGGQEKENALFFQHKGIARISRNLKQLEEDIFAFLTDDVCAEEIRSKMAALRKEHAADRIASDILQTIMGRKP